MLLFLLVLDRKQATIAWLSQWQMTRRFCHESSQAAHARMIGISTFSVIERCYDELS